MSRKTLNIHNDFTGLSLVGFDAIEIDLLSAVCHEMQNQGTTEVTISFEKLIELSQYKGDDNARLFEDLRSMDNKLASLNFRRSTDDTYMRFTLFPTFSLSRTEQQVTVAVNNNFVYLLNELGSQYTAIELMESASLRSRYSKQIYKRLKQYRDTGIWIISVADFRSYLDIPKTYRMTQIEERVIKVALEELSQYFDNLDVKKEVRHKAHHRGRPRYDTLVWHFKPQKNISAGKKVAAQQNPDSNSRNTKRPRKRKMTCPVCGKASVVELTAKDGHNFWKCESCGQTFGSMAEVKGYSKTPSRTLKIDDTETKSEEVYIPGIEEINQLKKSLSMKSAKTANDTTDEQKSEEHTSGKKVVNPVPVKHDITKCANPMARALDAIIWPYVERNALDYPIIPKGELRKVLGMDKSYSDEDLLTMLKEALSVLVDLGWYDDIQIQVGKYKNGHMKDVLLMPFVKTSQA